MWNSNLAFFTILGIFQIKQFWSHWSLASQRPNICRTEQTIRAMPNIQIPAQFLSQKILRRYATKGGGWGTNDNLLSKVDTVNCSTLLALNICKNYIWKFCERGRPSFEEWRSQVQALRPRRNTCCVIVTYIDNAWAPRPQLYVCVMSKRLWNFKNCQQLFFSQCKILLLSFRIS
jgi:hypothetical protein